MNEYLLIKFFLFCFRFWFFKFAAAVAIIIGAFFIPEGTFTTGKKSSFFFNCVMLIFYKEIEIIVAWNCNYLFPPHPLVGKIKALCKLLFFLLYIDCENEIMKSEPVTHLWFFAFFFLSVWFYVGMAGAFCFILIQLVLLIDFAHSWNESWVEKMEEGNSRCWYAGKLFVLQNIFKIAEV